MLPAPAIVRMTSGALMVFAGRNPSGLCRLVDPISHAAEEAPLDDVAREIGGQALLIARRIGGAGVDPRQFGMRWFLPTIWRYRRPLGHVLAASLFVQIFALTTPLFFQVVVDKVLTHRGYETLFVLVGGLVIIGLFDVALQYLRTYALSHTTNRIDVELGQRLFAHLLRLPVAYFETRSTGQTVARVRELETIRSFLTGQALFSAIDLVFAFVFIAVLFAYSWPLTLIVLAGIPFYLVIGFSVRPPLRELVGEKFNRGAASQQFLVETIVGVNTVKSAAVEPIMRAQWEEKLAAYVKTSFCRRDARLGRAARDPICEQADHRGAAPVRRQGGHRRRTDRRRARRLQHDRLAGDPADPAPVAALAGFPAGADLDRAPGRHPQRNPRILARRRASCRRRRAARSNSPMSASATGRARRKR